MLRSLLRRLPPVRAAALLLLAAVLLPLPALAGDGPAPGADRHKERGVACADCHGKAKKPTYVEAVTCLGCHGPAEALSQKTAAVKPENPHASPHWGAQMECAVCHRQHKPTVNWCDHCHLFKFQVP
jgi:RecJ-like exonuclease